MTDDPRDILKVAGVECTEVGEYGEWCEPDTLLHARVDDDGKWIQGDFVYKARADAAILALAKMVAEYRWMLWKALEYYAPRTGGLVNGTAIEQAMADLAARYEERE